jgi:serine/threonine-protein kinase
MLQPGDQVGPYQIQRRLGQGGMGTLYLARDPVLERLVAVKLFLGDLDRKDARARFTPEARAVASLNHSNIVTVYDYGEVSSQPYIVMEFIEGETIADLIRDKVSVSAVDKLRWMEELCEGVAYAHRIGIIHRDLKPANLMIDRLRRLKVLDFGIARMRGTLASNSTALLGTPGYMAPEQLRGGTIDHRSDLFSIGVVAYELVSYVEAFPGDNGAAQRPIRANPGRPQLRCLA